MSKTGSKRVIAYHLILSTYGFWLPNDPRGSWSEFVRDYDIFLAGGPATKVSDKRSYARDEHDHQKRRAAKAALARLPVRFSGAQARAVARGFASYVERSGLVVLACSIMPEHVHLVFRRTPLSYEAISNKLKGAATNQLSREQLHPFASAPYDNGRLPSPWARGEWACFIGDEAYVQNAIGYVERNPTRDGLRKQHWSFVQPDA